MSTLLSWSCTDRTCASRCSTPAAVRDGCSSRCIARECTATPASSDGARLVTDFGGFAPHPARLTNRKAISASLSRLPQRLQR
jgi:hypothetical protein